MGVEITQAGGARASSSSTTSPARRRAHHLDVLQPRGIVVSPACAARPSCRRQVFGDAEQWRVSVAQKRGGDKTASPSGVPISLFRPLPSFPMSLDGRRCGFGGHDWNGILESEPCAEPCGFWAERLRSVTWTTASSAPWLIVTPRQARVGRTQYFRWVLQQPARIRQRYRFITLTLTGAGNTVGPIAVR